MYLKYVYRSRKLRKLAAIALFGTTVAIVTAKHDNDFRDWSKEHIPALDNMVKIIFQEEQTYLESLDKAHKAVSARLVCYRFGTSFKFSC